MAFTFENRGYDSPLVEGFWQTVSDGREMFTSVAESHWGMVVTRQKGKLWMTVRGPETKASPSPIPEDAEFFGINFRLGTFMPPMPAQTLVDNPQDLPEIRRNAFWFNGEPWEFPTFENADTFVERLVKEGLLAHEPVVEAALQGDPTYFSLRSVQRRFQKVTGLTYATIRQIERARRAASLLEQGVSILDTIDQAGYFDQPHLTRSLKHFIGQTPAQLLRGNRPE